MIPFTVVYLVDRQLILIAPLSSQGLLVYWGLTLVYNPENSRVIYPDYICIFKTYMMTRRSSKVYIYIIIIIVSFYEFVKNTFMILKGKQTNVL